MRADDGTRGAGPAAPTETAGAGSGAPTVPAVVTVRYWAGARAAAGTGEDRDVTGVTLADVVAEVTRRRPALVPVLAVASLLVDGVRSSRDVRMSSGAVVEVLPPFAGG